MPTATKPEKVRTTLMLDAALVKETKHYAIDVDRDMQDVVAEALRLYLADRRADGRRPKKTGGN